MSNKKGYKHLTWNDRLTIEKMLLAGYKPPQIAEVIGCCRATVYNEIKRATYTHHTGDYWKSEERYAPELAEERYRNNLKAKGRALKITEDTDLAEHIEDIIINKKYSPQAALLYIQNEEKKYNVEIKSVHTIYNYIRRGDVFENLTMQDCPYRPKKQKKQTVRRAKRATQGKSIEQRPESVESREEFGHWEMDTVKGKKENKKTVLVLTERKTRKEIVEPMKRNTTEETIRALNRIEKEFGSRFFSIFKTITVDNGTEFADNDGMEKALYRVGKRADVYYCHPYRSCERGSNENQNKLIRRHLPKGSDFDKLVNKKTVKEIQEWINNYPRVMFGGKTSEMLFADECNKIEAG